MSEQREIKKAMIKNILLDFVVFLMMFLIFDGIIYNQISNSLYSTIDEELNRYKQQYEEIGNKDFKEKNDVNNFKGTIEEQENIDKPLDEEELYKAVSPRVISITRDEDGEIIRSESIGDVYEDFESDISFNSSILDTIYSLEVRGEYYYRAINFQTTNENGKQIYVQLLANVDGEIQTLKNLTTVLLWGTIALLVIALGASYVLAKRVVAPIMKNYKKQTEFVQNASHELRTPLAIIQAQQELLLKEPNSKIIDQSENINQTLKETKRMTKLIKELMDLARSDNYETQINKTEFDINELIKEIVTPYKEYAKLEQKEIILELNDVKKIKADRNRISELIIIVLDNSIKYTNPQDTITIKTERKEGKLILEIADTGIGIDDKTMPHIFERFYRGDESHSKKIEGSGLGLSIAQSIVDMHKGTIKAMHNSPKGTKILIKL